MKIYFKIMLPFELQLFGVLKDPPFEEKTPKLSSKYCQCCIERELIRWKRRYIGVLYHLM